MWTKNPQAQKAYLAKRFQLEDGVQSGQVRAAADDSCVVYLNGHRILAATGTTQESTAQVNPDLFRKGENLLFVEGNCLEGMAAVGLQLSYTIGETDRFVVTDRSWESWEPEPAGWPQTATKGGPVRVLGRLQEAVWKEAHFEQWPGNHKRDDFFAGRPLPEGAWVSDPIQITVRPRRIESRRDPDHLIGIQWGSYFYKQMFYWHNTQAVPIVGLYESTNPDVIRQHALWLMDMGVDFLFADWPIYIPPDEDGDQHWEDRHDSANGQIHVTETTLEVYAQMREEGFPVPQMVIMPFLANGPSNGPETVNEQLEWLYNYFIRNPRFEGLWVIVDGKPLTVLLHNTLKPAWEVFEKPINEDRFTVRYMGAQLQLAKVDQYGYWSWMDGSPDPVVTFRGGDPEVCTPSAGFFGPRGWLAEGAWGRRNGATLLRTFRAALEHRPRFVLFHQWNEFTGQYEGYSYGDDNYGDSYSVELSDDIEPVSLTADGYRGDDGGYGFHPYNVAKALVAIYKQEVPEDTLMAVYPPAWGQVMEQNTLEIGWEVIGKKPESYDVFLDGKAIARTIQGESHAVDLNKVPPGQHTVSVAANGAQTRFELARDKEDVPLTNQIPVTVQVPFVLSAPGE
jgi:hypothetical protein